MLFVLPKIYKDTDFGCYNICMFDNDTRPWARRRRLIIAGPFVGGFALYVLVTLFMFFFGNPTCFDGRKNGGEDGTDCGGKCVRICAFEVLPPKVIWANSFKINEGQYNSVAYVENPNQLAGTKELNYTFTLKNGGQVVAERKGTTILPPNSIYPIFEGRIFTFDSSPITETVIRIEPPEVWQPATIGAKQFRTLDLQLSNADARPRLDATVENTTITTATDIEVVATIFNDEGQPVTASQTIVEEFAGESVADVTFTWPSPIAKTVRSCIVPTDVAMVIDLSGSMNNDNENPPQPLTDALQAASTFATNLDKNDALSLITFASDAKLIQPLTKNLNNVSNTILSLSINPEEETGFTNTVSALQAAAKELNSDNHNQDARRVIVILTDGLPTDPDDERPIIEEAEQLANQIDLSGVSIYAIGLGEDLDRDFVRNIASTHQTAYFASTGKNLEADLLDIYATITGAICETGPTKIDVIAKTTANFVPLR